MNDVTTRNGLSCGGPFFASQWVEGCATQTLERAGGREEKWKASPLCRKYRCSVVWCAGFGCLSDPFEVESNRRLHLLLLVGVIRSYWHYLLPDWAHHESTGVVPASR